MPIATFRGEKSVAEVADKLYVRLTPRQREKAEAAILKANPQLSDIRNVPEGTILRVPDLPELRTKMSRSLENPDAQIAKTLADMLTSYTKELSGRIKNDQEATKSQLTLLKSAKFRREIANAPSLQALADQAMKTLDARAKSVGERQKLVEAAVKQALSDLDERWG